MQDSGVPVFQNNITDGVLSDTLKQRILAELENNPTITQENLANRLGISRRSLQRKMINLQAADYIERNGSKRYGSWIVKKM